ncbi:Art10p Ecym_3267 [Eremothecium cymbalariae DBVPG|uniref:Arrestin-like N-terminal domain-containing protein n=1 Tax=Eremothecium cymbalariae (strain CBS 270.75 / DBVPG 7215 / KCTC 17166 / NRRL Y-17582) TaxID=931890 RepID=G8JRJ1_ERECY|nr:Hypothetical protein Ecym_3267 [Eremothecium cymbalariae DBVPG\
MAPTVSIRLHPSCNGEYYTEREIISGSIVLELKELTYIERLTVSLRGITQTTTIIETDRYHAQQSKQKLRWPYEKDRSTHVVFNESIILFPSKKVSDVLGEEEGGFGVTQGRYCYNFSFQLAGNHKCLSQHQAKYESFLEGEKAVINGSHLPPSFNDSNIGKNPESVDLFFYSLGRVRYVLKTDLTLGEPQKYSLAPGSLIADTQLIKFMPTQCNSCTDPCQYMVNPSRAVLSYCSPEVLLPGDAGNVTLQVNSKGLDQLHRMDYLFKQNTDKFDRLQLLFNKPSYGLDIKLVYLQLDLIEHVDYLANNIKNNNISQLTVMIEKMDYNLSLEKLHQTKNDMWELPIELGWNANLNRLRFNEENYTHRGNKLFSFTSCNIERRFWLKLKLSWKIQGMPINTEVIIDPVTVFADVAQSLIIQPPPEYEEPPPKYEEILP